jgi:hypothetical protein
MEQPQQSIQRLFSILTDLGRPKQVERKSFSGGKDVVTHIEYDQFGRQVKIIFPFHNPEPRTELYILLLLEMPHQYMALKRSIQKKYWKTLP